MDRTPEIREAEQEIIDSLRPMSELVDLGILYMLNRDYMIPKGFVIGVYIDNDQGHTALGWSCITVETAKEIGILPDTATQAQREKAFDDFRC